MPKNKKAVVLLSGGQDSTTSLFWALAMGYEVVSALSFCYGQRHVAELVAAKEIAKLMDVPHNTIELGTLLGSTSALTNSALQLHGDGGFPDAEMPQGLPTSFVPGRNLIFLSLAAIHAVSLGAKNVITGVCQTDYSGYPDCRQRFIESIEDSINLAMPTSVGQIVIQTPLMNLTKAATVTLMRSFDPIAWRALGMSVTCYHGKRPGCGECPACQLRAKGFQEAGIDDPAE